MSLFPNREPKEVARRAVRDASVMVGILVGLRIGWVFCCFIWPVIGRPFYVVALIDAVVLGVLAYGTYRLNRLCVILLLLYSLGELVVRLTVDWFAHVSMAPLV